MFYTGWDPQRPDQQGAQAKQPANPRTCSYCKLAHFGRKCPVQCKRCGYGDHTTQRCNAPSPNRPNRCSRCKTPDHWYDQCPKWHPNQGAANKGRNGDNPSKGIYARIVTGAQSGFTMSPTRHTAQNPFENGSRPTFRKPLISYWQRLNC
jgi:hypothetical protein